MARDMDWIRKFSTCICFRGRRIHTPEIATGCNKSGIFSNQIQFLWASSLQYIPDVPFFIELFRTGFGPTNYNCPENCADDIWDCHSRCNLFDSSTLFWPLRCVGFGIPVVNCPFKISPYVGPVTT
jgi:hypothetical protein